MEDLVLAGLTTLMENGHTASVEAPSASYKEALTFFETLYNDDPPLPETDRRGMPEEDVFSGTPEETYLSDLYDTQIPSMQQNIKDAVADLDPIRDKALIGRLNILSLKLEDVRGSIRYGNLAPKEAYEQIKTALDEMRDETFRTTVTKGAHITRPRIV